jgi:hypothetical protein
MKDKQNNERRGKNELGTGYLGCLRRWLQMDVLCCACVFYYMHVSMLLIHE